MLRIFSRFAHNDLDDPAVLTKVVAAPQSIQQPIFAYGGSKAGHVYEVLLDNAEACKMFATEGVGLGFLGFLLPYLRVLLGLLRDELLVFGHPASRQWCQIRGGGGNLLFGSDVFPFYRRLVVGSTTGRAEAIHRRLDIIEAELAYLWALVSKTCRETHPPGRRGGPKGASVPGSRRDTGGSSCRTSRTPRRRGGSTRPRHRRRTGPVVCGTWRRMYVKWCR